MLRGATAQLRWVCATQQFAALAVHGTLLRWRRDPSSRLLVATTHLARDPESAKQQYARGFQYGVRHPEGGSLGMARARSTARLREAAGSPGWWRRDVRLSDGPDIKDGLLPCVKRPEILVAFRILY